MKLNVLMVHTNIKLLLASLLLFCSAYLYASNAVCPSPPGGQVTCDDGQLAFCRVNKVSGVEAGCRTPPKELSKTEMKAWTLSQVLGKEVSTADVSAQEYADILRKGSTSTEGASVTFKAPPEVTEKVLEEVPDKKKLNQDQIHNRVDPHVIKPDKIKPEVMTPPKSN